MEAHTKLLVLQPDSTEPQSRTEQSQQECETELQKLAERKRSDELKSKLRRFLLERPRNYAAAAKHLNISRSTVLRLIAESQEEFDDLESAFLDELEEKCILATQGRVVDENFRFVEALKVLERLRPERWSAKASAKKQKPTVATLSKETMQLLREAK